MRKIKTRYTMQKRKGFSIIEVVISLAVVTVGLISILNLMGNNIQASFDARDRVIAAQLAQEGAELALYVKNNHDLGTANGSYCLDYSYAVGNLASQKCTGTGANKPALYKDAITDFYRRDTTGTETKFKRAIYVDATTDTTKYTVSSFVTWGGTNPATFTSTTSCTDKCAVAQLEIIKTIP